MSTISALPSAPSPSDTQSQFNSKAFAWVAALATFVSETNVVAGEVNSNASAASASQTAAETAETNAEAAYVAALSVANAEPYNAGTTYDVGDAVIGSNGLTYVRINASGSGDNPVTSVTGNWQQVNVRPPSFTDHTSSPSLSISDLDGTVVHTTIGASGEVVFALPAGYEGAHFKGYVGAAQNFKLTFDGSETGRYQDKTSAGGGFIQSSTIGNYIEATWLTSYWLIKIIGKWSIDGSTNIGQLESSPELRGELDCLDNSVGFTLQSSTGDGTTTIDWRNGNLYKFTFGAQSETFTFTAPTKPGTLTLILVQDGVGSRTITWPTIKWIYGTAPTLSTGASAEDIVVLVYDGTNYYGSYGLGYATP